MPPERGVFLDVTRRMHPDVCRFVSEAVYEGRLSRPTVWPQWSMRVGRSPAPSWCGRATRSAAQKLAEEATRVAEIRRMLRAPTPRTATTAITLDDIHGRQPVQRQVRCLQGQLPA